MRPQNLLPNVAVRLLHSQRTIAPPIIGEGENESVASHCVDLVFTAQKKITCCRSVLIRSTSNAISAYLRVILRPLTVVDRMLVRLNNNNLRAPMGLSSSSDEWCRHSNRVVEGFPSCKKIVDDILIWAPSLAALEDRLHKVLRCCSDLHITLSRLKFQIDRSLKFAGCIVSDEGVKPDPDRIAALSDFPVPTDQTSVRSFLGLCNQLAFFVPDYQHHTVALRQLTGKGRPFFWLPEHSSPRGMENVSG